MRESGKKERTNTLMRMGLFLLLLLIVFTLGGCLSVTTVKPQDSKSQDNTDCSRDRSEEAKTGKPMCKEYWPQEEGGTYRWQPLKKK